MTTKTTKAARLSIRQALDAVFNAEAAVRKASETRGDRMIALFGACIREVMTPELYAEVAEAHGRTVSPGSVKARVAECNVFYKLGELVTPARAESIMAAAVKACPSDKVTGALRGCREAAKAARDELASVGKDASAAVKRAAVKDAASTAKEAATGTATSVQDGKTAKRAARQVASGSATRSGPARSVGSLSDVTANLATMAAYIEKLDVPARAEKAHRDALAAIERADGSIRALGAMLD